MPELCRFDGIIIRMFPSDHPPPHVHAVYAEFIAKIEINHPHFVEGRFPPREARKVQYWISIRQTELLMAWERAVCNQPVGKIAPPSR